MNETAGAQTKNQKSEGGRITVVVSILIITFGVGLYLNNHHVIPGVDWFWVLGLTIVGLLILTLGGIDKFSIVAGPYLMCLAGFIFLSNGPDLPRYRYPRVDHPFRRVGSALLFPPRPGSVLVDRG